MAFGPDGRTLLTGSADGTARLRDVPDPVEGDVERIECWIQFLTGLEFDDYDAIRPMDTAAWRENRRRLDDLGGPPKP